MLYTFAAICFGCFYPPSPPSPPSPPGNVTLTYTMFIPLNHVRKTEAILFDNFFAGDNKANYSGAGTYRIQQELVINTNTRQVTSIGRSGITREYRYPNNLSSATNCFRKTCSACPTYYPSQDIIHQGKCLYGTPIDTGPANNMGSIQASVVSSSAQNMKVRFQGNPGNDLQIGAPGITWDHEITISWNNNQPTFQLNMDNDGFPTHQVRINGTVRGATHPICDGATPSGPGNTCFSNTPISLFPPMDVETTWSGAL